MKISLTSVYVDDTQKAFKFYTEVLGFIGRMYVPEAFLAVVASPEEPTGTGLLLEPNENPLTKPYQAALFQQGIPVIVFGVQDIQSEFERLTAHGVVFRKPPTKTDFGFEAVLEDTCGNLVSLAQVNQVVP